MEKNNTNPIAKVFSYAHDILCCFVGFLRLVVGEGRSSFLLDPEGRGERYSSMPSFSRNCVTIMRFGCFYPDRENLCPRQESGIGRQNRTNPCKLYR